MARIAENVSFALENFERAGEKAKADAQKERLARMLAALSATNEAIVRATSRTELFELVCEAAAKGGRFNSTSILLARSDSDYHRYGGRGGADCQQHAPGKGFDQRGSSGRARALRQRVPRPAALHRQRSARGSAWVGVPPIHPQRRRNVGAAFPLHGLAASAVGRDVLHLLREATRSRPNSPSCCSGSPTMCRSRSRISIAPTKRRGPRARRNA